MPSRLVQRLRSIQDKHGYLPDAELRKLSSDINLSLPRIQEVASFFPHFRQEWNPPPRVEVLVCRDMACHRAGSAELLHGKTGLMTLEDPQRMQVCIEGTSCLGRCDRGPAIMVTTHGNKHDAHDHVYAGRPLDEVKRIVKQFADDAHPPAPDTDISYTPQRNTYQVDPYKQLSDLKPYEAVRRFLEKFPLLPSNEKLGKEKGNTLADRHPWLARLDLSSLLGMGGAGMPVFQKWSDLWNAKGDEKYVVCNGDESEPSTFKDRELLLRMPHLVVEGMILGGLLTGAKAGFIFIRHEYTEQIEAVRKEIVKAVELNRCGDNIAGTSRCFKLEVFASPGGYICGEQSALLEAIESRRAQPRNRPPELTTNGLYDKPTIVNNVESISWVPSVLLRGGEWYAGEGVKVGVPEYDDRLKELNIEAPKGVFGFKGRRFFSICGDLQKPGVFEVPIGTTLGELVELAGGVTKGQKLQAVAPSGPSGGFFPHLLPVPDGTDAKFDKLCADLLKTIKEGTDRRKLETAATELAQFRILLAGKPFVKQDGKLFYDILKSPLDLNFFRGALTRHLGCRPSFMLGAGLAVYSDAADMAVEARNCTQFFRNESCGKCVPCRIGGQKLVALTTAVVKAKNKSVPDDEDADGPEIPAAPPSKALVAEIDRTLELTSICALGASVPKPLMTYLNWFDPSAKRGG